MRLLLMIFSLSGWAGEKSLSPNGFGAYPVRWNAAGFQQPESAYLDLSSGLLFVSNVAGAPDQKDGVGWIDKLDPKTGAITAAKWVKGLNAPKGMRSASGVLWVSDIDTLVGIEIATGRIKTRVKVPGAKFLNDVAIDSEGVVYVSDTIGSQIFKFAQGKLSVFAAGDTLESPNGLLVEGGSLVVAAWGLTTDWTTKTPGFLYRLDLKSKQRTNVSQAPVGNLDGLESLGNGKYLVSDWSAGKVYEIGSDGKPTLVLSKMAGTADVAILENPKLLIVPRMGDGVVTAFSLSTTAISN